MTTASHTFSVGYSTLLDPQGNTLQDLPDRYKDRQLLTSLYRAMKLNRQFDAKAIALQRSGRLGTYASSLGQEAIGIGIAAAMTPDDVLVPSFREHGAQLYRGVSVRELLLYWGGDERGSDFSVCTHDFPVCVTVGGHVPHAAGVALALKLKKSSAITVCLFGDGATSKGDVYEAMNIAGAWQLPVLFVVCNNRWAISTSLSTQTHCETLAQKAVAAGIAGLQVDGNDVISVHNAATEAIRQIRSTLQPVLLEAITYRLGDHTTSDDARRYRNDSEVSEQWKNDPLARLQKHLVLQHQWSKNDEEQLTRECEKVVETGASQYLAEPPQDPAALFDYMFASLPDTLRLQRQAFLADLTPAEQPDD